MPWETFYLTCFLLGLILSLLTFFSGIGHIHIGHFHMGSHPHIRIGAHKAGVGLSAFNGFTLTAFLCWFGGAGYLLQRYSPFAVGVSMLLAITSGLFGALLLWLALFKLLLPRERILEAADTEMTGVVAQVIGTIRETDGIGEILFSQLGSRRASPARSEDGSAIARGTEVIVLRYERGVAFVKPWAELDRQ